MSELPGNTEKWLQINQKVKEKWLIETFRLLRKNEIEPILIKGRAAAEYYPQKHQRRSLDIDICVAPENYQKAFEILKNNPTPYGIVDLHDGLRQHDTLDWQNLYDNAIPLKLDNCNIKVLRPEDHLRVLCVHWLIDGGEYKERLYDIYWLIKNRPKDFDWNRCLDVVPQNRRRWIICVIGIAHKYLNLEIEDLPFADEAEHLPKWLTKTVEKQWRSDIRLAPISFTSIKNPQSLIQQIKKRLPPNPITATVLVEGSFDGKTRFFYQIENFFSRLKVSARKRRKIFHEEK